MLSVSTLVIMCRTITSTLHGHKSQIPCFNNPSSFYTLQDTDNLQILIWYGNDYLTYNYKSTQLSETNVMTAEKHKLKTYLQLKITNEYTLQDRYI